MAELTANKLPKASDGTHLVDSRISDDGTIIGLPGTDVRLSDASYHSLRGLATDSTGKIVETAEAVPAYTVSTLPSVVGKVARVTDGDVGLSWGDTVVNTGAGATKYLVWHNGTVWTVVGK